MLMYAFHYVFSLLPGGTWNPLGQSGWSNSLATTVKCDSLIHTFAFENTTILSASYLSAGSYISDTGPFDCDKPISPPTDVCQVHGEIKTSSSSSVNFVMWFPDPDKGWNHRFLTLGNSYIGGCIEYESLSYGASMGFATISSDNGHTGDRGEQFLNNPEVIIDFAHRAIHVAATVGKVLVQSYYSVMLSSFKSYYLGCSTGGRQGTQSALMYPEDFDGIVAGAPAIDWNHLMSWGGMLTKYLGPPSGPSFIPQNLWKQVNEAIIKECGNKHDRFLTEPDNCHFDPGTLPLCTKPEQQGCFSEQQVDALRKFYEPLRGEGIVELYPRFDPGAELDFYATPLEDGTFFYPAEHWFKYAVYNDSSLTPEDFWHFGPSDVKIADSINPGGIATWSGDFSKFKSLGGKLLAYHGRADGAIPSGISKKLHGLISSTTSNIDDFYRLFLVPGLHHCINSPNSPIEGAAWDIGQGPNVPPPSKNNSDHNILLALVDWVENKDKAAPSSIIGFGDKLEERLYCMYPKKSGLVNGTWECMSQ